VGETTKLPASLVQKTVSPIVVIVHGRLFKESAKGFVKSNKAYIEEDDYVHMF